MADDSRRVVRIRASSSVLRAFNIEPGRDPDWGGIFSRDRFELAA